MSHVANSLHRRLNLSGESRASGSPLLSRLDEKKLFGAPDDRMNIGLANDFVRLEDEPPPPPLAEPNLTLDSDSGKKPPLLRGRKKGDFIPL